MLDYEKIGQKIRALRKNCGMSQEQLAEKVWISTTHMSHIETGSTKLSLPVLVDLAKVLGVGTDELLATELSEQKTASVDNIQSLLYDCTSQQLAILTEILTSAKRAMDKHL